MGHDECLKEKFNDNRDSQSEEASSALSLAHKISLHDEWQRVACEEEGLGHKNECQWM